MLPLIWHNYFNPQTRSRNSAPLNMRRTADETVKIEIHTIHKHQFFHHMENWCPTKVFKMIFKRNLAEWHFGSVCKSFLPRG